MIGVDLTRLVAILFFSKKEKSYPDECACEHQL